MYKQDVIDKVRNTDMVDFLAAEYGWSIVKVGSCYSTKEHDSIRVRADRKHWYWNSREIGGVSVIDWLDKIEGMSFVETMKKMAGISYTSATIADHFTQDRGSTSFFDPNGIPLKTDSKYSHLFAYLTETRCISKDVVSTLVKEKRIYQDTRNNVVFTNRDEDGNIKFWSLRGTNTAKKYTKNAPGSENEYYGFTLDCNPNSNTVYVFEAPIDLLSHCTVADIKAKRSGAWREQNRIALLGVNDYALECYLQTHQNIETIKFCLDNDEAGITATEKHSKKYSELGYNIEHLFYNGSGKDMNEVLCSHVHRMQIKELAQKDTPKKVIPVENEQTSKNSKSEPYTMIK